MLGEEVAVSRDLVLPKTRILVVKIGGNHAHKSDEKPARYSSGEREHPAESGLLLPVKVATPPRSIVFPLALTLPQAYSND